VERSWGVLGEGVGQDLIITVGTMVLGFIRQTTISSLVVPLFSKFLKIRALQSY